MLVTGASGFIGANLTRALLSADAEVHALVRSEAARPEVPAEATVHRADLRHPADLNRAVASARPDFVFHLAAAPGHPGDAAARAAMLADTVAGTANLLEAVRPLGVQRLVHVGGSLEYGHSSRPVKETDALEPVTFRGAAKAAATLLALEFAHATGNPVTILRPFAVYGPWERLPRFVPAVVTAALRGEPISVTSGGAGRDYVFVGDVVDACLLAATSPSAAGEIFNVGSGLLTTNDQLVERLAVVLALDLDVRAGHEPRPWDSGAWIADGDKARDLLGWAPAHDLDAGLAETASWFAEREAPVAGARG